jgi:hypothetical protein
MQSFFDYGAFKLRPSLPIHFKEIVHLSFTTLIQI